MRRGLCAMCDQFQYWLLGIANLRAIYAWVIRWHVTGMLSLAEHWNRRRALSNHVCAHSVIYWFCIRRHHILTWITSCMSRRTTAAIPEQYKLIWHEINVLFYLCVLYWNLAMNCTCICICVLCCLCWICVLYCICCICVLYWNVIIYFVITHYHFL